MAGICGNSPRCPGIPQECRDLAGMAWDLTWDLTRMAGISLGLPEIPWDGQDLTGISLEWPGSHQDSWEFPETAKISLGSHQEFPGIWLGISQECWDLPGMTWNSREFPRIWPGFLGILGCDQECPPSQGSRDHPDPGPADLRDEGEGEQRLLPGPRVPAPRAHHRPHRVPLQTRPHQQEIRRGGEIWEIWEIWDWE